MKFSLSAKLLSIVAGLLFAALTLPVHAGGRPCTAAGAEGSYGYTVNGRFYGNVPAAAVGVVTLDGSGGLTAKETADIYGTVTRRNLTGTYSVNSDCTGSATFSDGVNPPYNVDLVFVNDGREFMAVQTDSGTVITASGKKQ